MVRRLRSTIEREHCSKQLLYLKFGLTKLLIDSDIEIIGKGLATTNGVTISLGSNVFQR